MSQATRLRISSAPPAGPTALFHNVVRAVGQAPTSGDAMDALFAAFREGAGALALALEITADSVTRLQPYGDIAALIESPLGAKPGEDRATLFTVPVVAAGQPPGRLLLAVPRIHMDSAPRPVDAEM